MGGLCDLKSAVFFMADKTIRPFFILTYKIMNKILSSQDNNSF